MLDSKSPKLDTTNVPISQPEAPIVQVPNEPRASQKRERDVSFFPGMLVELDMDSVEHQNYASSFLPVTILSISDDVFEVGIQFFSNSRTYNRWKVGAKSLYHPRGPSFLDTFKVGESVEVRYFESPANDGEAPVVSWWRARITESPSNPRICDFYTVEFIASFTEESPTDRVRGSCIRKATPPNPDSNLSVKKNKVLNR